MKRGIVIGLCATLTITAGCSTFTGTQPVATSGTRLELETLPPRASISELPDASASFAQASATEPVSGATISASVTESAPAIQSQQLVSDEPLWLSAEQAYALACEVVAPLVQVFGRGYSNETIPVPNTCIRDLTPEQWEEYMFQLPIVGLRYNGADEGPNGEQSWYIYDRIFGRYSDSDREQVGSHFVMRADTNDLNAYLRDAFGPEIEVALPGSGPLITEFYTGSGDDADMIDVLEYFPEGIEISNENQLSLRFRPAAYDWAGDAILVATVIVQPDEASRYGCNVVSFQFDIADEQVSPGTSYDFIFPESDVCFLSEADLNHLFRFYPAWHNLSMSAETALGIARNEIYARHGNTFDNPFYQEHFGQFSWYTPTHKVQESELNEIEKANVQCILRWEQQLSE